MNMQKSGLLTLVAVLALGLSASPMFQNYVAYAQTDDEQDSQRDTKSYNDKRCVEADDGKLRCEGHSGECWRTDDGSVRCETQDKRCVEVDDGTFRCEGHDGKCMKNADGAIHCEAREIKERPGDMTMDQKERMMKHVDMAGEDREALMAKYRAMHDDLTDDQRDAMKDEMKTKYMDHYKMKIKAKHDSMTDKVRDELQNRYEEMKAYKMELRSKYDAMTDLEKEQFHDNFLAKAKEKRLAWISPLKQMIAGIDVDEIECREGLNLVVKNSNGVAMCLKSSTAEKLIERGLVTPSI